MEPEVETFSFAPDGDIPNNSLPLLLYRDALPPELQSPAAARRCSPATTGAATGSTASSTIGISM